MENMFIRIMVSLFAAIVFAVWTRNIIDIETFHTRKEFWIAMIPIYPVAKWVIDQYRELK